MADTTALSESHTQMTQLLLPKDANQLWRALGGSVLHWMDVATAIAAMRFSNEQCVTVAIEGVDFEGAIDLGDVVDLEAYVFNAGRTSMDVRVVVEAEDTDTGERRRAASASVTYVAVDDDGRPVDVPDLTCPTEAEEALRERALEAERDRLESSLARFE